MRATVLPARVHRITFQLRRLVHSLPFSEITRPLYHRCRYLLSLGTMLKNAKYLNAGGPDGLALPPAHLVHLVMGQFSIKDFYESGALGAECIHQTLTKNGQEIAKFSSILDFGCGCGRVMSHWSGLKETRLYGTDCNSTLIEWCRSAIPFVQFSVNGLGAKLPYVEAQFDFVYGISVFTHLDEELQQFWIGELRRVLKPGGFLYLTTHGESYLNHFTEKEHTLFNAGHVVVVGARFAGKNSCAVLHPESYVRRVLAKDFRIVDFIPVGARDVKQDVYLLQKPVHGR